MDVTKIRLSQEEAALLMKPDWILTKNRILQKVMQLLGQLQEAQQTQLEKAADGLPREVIAISSKISKGENYKGLPWLVLDYPRYFEKDQVFAIRALFWWGHFFSSTLHLTGAYKNLYAGKIIAAFDSLQQDGFFICIHENPWEHHFEAGNYIALQEIDAKRFEEIVQKHAFLKLSRKIPLQEWNDAIKKLLTVFNTYMKLCSV